jgi:hypothetical protein
MNIFDLADALNKQIKITRHPNQNNRFSASFERCEIKQGGILKSEYGDGKTPMEAINRYSNAIQGKMLVFNAYRDDRAEFVAPTLESV